MTMEPFTAHAEGEQRRRVLRELIQAVLQNALDHKYKRKVLSDLIWKYTEADGKYKTRQQRICE